MKLIKCYIENFGKLQNFEYIFNDGINVIKEENGFGKTTFAVFIKSMFYGLDSSKSENSERKKYKPWQGGKYGGNIEFEVEGKKYKIERFFGNKATEDTYKIYDLETNLETKDYTENIGEEIFKINKSAYERSTYIPQGQIQIEMEDSLSAKLGNVLESDNDINTSEKALKALTDSLKIYKKTGKRGLINEKKETLNELKRELEKRNIDEKNLDERKESFKNIISQIKSKEQERKEKQEILNKKIEEGRKKANQETYKNLEEDLKESEIKYKNLMEFFKGQIPEDEELEEIREKYFELERYKIEIKNQELSAEENRKLAELEKEIGIKEQEKVNIPEIEKAISNCSTLADLEKEIEKIKISKKIIEEKNNLQKSNKKNKKTAKILKILLAFVILAGICAIILLPNPIIGIVITVLGIVLEIIAILMSKNAKEEQSGKSNLNDEMEKLYDEYTEIISQKEKLSSEIEDVLSIFMETKDLDNKEKIIKLTDIKSKISIYDDLKNKKKQKENEKTKLVGIKEELEQKIKHFLTKYFEELTDSYGKLIQELILQKSNYKTIINEIEKNKKDLKEYEETHNLEEIKQNIVNDKEEIDEQQLGNQIEALSQEIDKLYDEKNQLKNQIEIIENKIDEYTYLESDIENLEQEITDLKYEHNILQKTRDLLEEAKNNFSSYYLKDMIKEFKKYIEMLDNKNLKTSVDINLGVNVEVNGANHEIKYFSAGYKDLIYLCMRFSLIKALFEKELPFVMLDDPFVNLDDDKIKKAIDLMKEISKEYQLIYFTCNTNRIIA